jgi:hypothetical protein
VTAGLDISVRGARVDGEIESRLTKGWAPDAVSSLSKELLDSNPGTSQVHLFCSAISGASKSQKLS